MSYEMFADLVKTESTLRRDLHSCPPRQAGVLSRAIDQIHRQLRACPSYEKYLRRMAFSVDAMG